VAPVPIFGAGDNGRITPVLVVITDAVGDLKFSVIDLQIDGSDGVRDGVGPVQVWEKEGVQPLNVRIAGVVGWITLIKIDLSQHRIVCRRGLVHTDFKLKSPVTPILGESNLIVYSTLDFSRLDPRNFAPDPFQFAEIPSLSLSMTAPWEAKTCPENWVPLSKVPEIWTARGLGFAAKSPVL
jgi:hypothetical protein